MASLYELTGQMEYLKELLEDPEVEEQVVLETMESIEYEIEEKADGYAKIIRMLSSEVDTIDGEIEILSARKKALSNNVNRLKSSLTETMILLDKRKFKTPLFSFNIQKNPCYTAGKKITVKGLMLHSVGCPQPKASAFISSWNKESFDNACVHAFIDGNDGTVYQTLPWNHRGWHCGKGENGSGNNTYIGVEMCEPDCIKYTGGSTFICSDPDEARLVAKRTYAAAVELFAFLCEKYKLDPKKDGVIISHKEGHARGLPVIMVIRSICGNS